MRRQPASRSSSRRGPGAVFALLGALMLLVTGCGGGGGGGEAAGGGTGPTPLTLIVGPVFFEHVYLAQEQGYFSDQNLEVTIKTGGTADAQIPQLLNGDAQIAMTGSVAMVNAAAKDLPVGITFGTANATPPVTSGLVVPEDSPIQSTGDLAGKKIGVAGLKGTPHLATMLSAEANGADPESITFVEVPLPTMTEALEDGTVAAAYVIGPFFSNVGEGTGFRLIESSATEYLANSPNVVFAASDRYIEENGEVIERFNEAMTKGTEYANANPDEIRRMDAEHTEQPDEYIQSRPLPPFVTGVDRDALQLTIDGMARFGFIENKPETGEVVSDLCPEAEA